MDHKPAPAAWFLRPAHKSDARKIRSLVWQAQINPTGINWQRFILAVLSTGEIIGCGQVKPHRDGSNELASIVVTPAWQGRGVARSLITHLIQANPGQLFLVCRPELEAFYRRFGFIPVISPLPPEFLRLKRIAGWLHRLRLLPSGPLIMQRPG